MNGQDNLQGRRNTGIGEHLTTMKATEVWQHQQTQCNYYPVHGEGEPQSPTLTQRYKEGRDRVPRGGEERDLSRPSEPGDGAQAGEKPADGR